MLKTALRRVWRDPGTVQFGTDPARAVVLSGVDDAVATVLGALDGSRDLDQIHDVARRCGLTTSDADALLDQLRTASVLDDGAAATGLADQRGLRSLLPWERQQLSADHAVWADQGAVPGRAGDRLRRRRKAGVRVVGTGRVGAQLAVLLAAGGVAAVEPIDQGLTQPADLAPGGLSHTMLDQARSDAVRDRIADTAPTASTSVADPDVVVLVGRTALLEVPHLMRAARAHLVVDVRPGSTLIGPFVRPGTSACSGCLDRFRTDRDARWPTVAAQLSADHDDAVDVGTAAVAAALAALQVFMHVDGDVPTAVNALLDVRLPDAATVWRPLSPHPLCGCTWPG